MRMRSAIAATAISSHVLESCVGSAGPVEVVVELECDDCCSTAPPLDDELGAVDVVGAGADGVLTEDEDEDGDDELPASP